MKNSAIPLTLLALLTILTPCVAESWTEIRCPLNDRNIGDRFEEVKALTNFQDGLGTIEATSGSQQAKATATLDTKTFAQPTARVDYEFAKKTGIQYVEVATNLPLDESRSSLALGVYYRQNQNTDNALKLRLRVTDKNGETHQFNLQPGFLSQQPDSDDPALCLAVVALTSSQKTCWGGDGNKQIDYPCKLYSIVADRPYNDYRGHGTLWIEKIALMRSKLESKELIVEVLDPPFGNIYAPDKPIKVRASCKTPGKPSDTVSIEAVDFWGKPVAKQRSELALQPKEPGYYACNIKLHRDGQVIEKRRLSFAALPKPDPKLANPYVGFCTHFRYNAYPLQVMDLMRRYGLTEFRDEISWANFETKPNEYALPDYGKQSLERANRLGMNPLLICDYGNRLYDKAGFPVSEKAVQAYAQHCAELVKQTSKVPTGRVESFEIWNEWSGGCGMNGKPRTNSPEAYAKLLTLSYKAIKAVDPSVTVVGLGGEHSEHHFEQIRRMLAAGAAKAADAFSVHPYRYPRSPEKSQLYEEILKIVDVIEAYGGKSRLWITEIGWPTHLGTRGVDEKTQADYIVRTLALLQATGHVDKVHWYDFKDDGLNRTYNENNFGVVRHQTFNCQPKPAAVAAAIFARETAGGTCLGLHRRGSLWAVDYRMPDDSRKHILWNTGKPIPLLDATTAIGLDIERAEQPEQKNIMGNPLDIPTTIELDGSPVYLCQ